MTTPSSGSPQSAATEARLRELAHAVGEASVARDERRHRDVGHDEWYRIEGEWASAVGRLQNYAKADVLLNILDAKDAELARLREELRRATERLKWIDDNAKHELVIDCDGDNITIKRWVRKYTTFYQAYGRDIGEAVDRFAANDADRDAARSLRSGETPE